MSRSIIIDVLVSYGHMCGRRVRTPRASVRVPSTSKRQIVFAIGRLSSGG